MAQTEPQFKEGDRFWTHYDYRWGTVLKPSRRLGAATCMASLEASCLTPPGTTCTTTAIRKVRLSSMLDDAHGNWDMARMVPPHIARRFGYGDDPKKPAA
jgi:hypothetical protein